MQDTIKPTRRIMYVDDDPEDRLLFEDALTAVETNIVLELAADGLEAYEHLSDPSSPSPSLLIIDLNMPRMNGKELIRKIKADDKLSSLPIVVLTTSASPDDRAECAGFGVDMHTKPITFDELKSTVGRLLSVAK